MISAIDLAKYIVYKANQSGRSITHLKLQKILYYLQGEFLKEFGRPLFFENIEAWQYGPVVPEVYYHYVPYGALNLYSENDEGSVISALSSEEQGCINRVLDDKLKYSASALVSAAHKERPWLEQFESVRDGLKPTISTNTIWQYFSEAQR